MGILNVFKKKEETFSGGSNSLVGPDPSIEKGIHGTIDRGINADFSNDPLTGLPPDDSLLASDPQTFHQTEVPRMSSETPQNESQFSNPTSSLGASSGFSSQAMNLSSMQMMHASSQQPQYSMPSGASGLSGDMGKDLQIISLKLDSIKSELDSMNQRIHAIELIAERENRPSQKKWY